MEIRKIGVLGSGVMGMGIAAHVANAGIPVVLLDIVPKDAADRNMLAKNAIEKALATDPAPFMDKRNAKLITPGNLEDNLDLLADCDWIIEVVLEDLKVKQTLYARLEEHIRKDAMVSSNTSTIPLHLLIEGRSADFARHFCITHFFNPPRYMRLLEIVQGPKTDKAALEKIKTFCDVRLGKGIVPCNDTPGFIANRIGTYWIQVAMQEAFDRGLSVEEADAMMGRPMGIPKTGVFGLVDLVGIDLIPHIGKSLCATLPKDDPYVKGFSVPALVEKMIKDGYTGRKGKGGFYSMSKEGGRRTKLAIDLKTGEYRESGKPKLPAADAGKQGLKAVMEHDSDAGRYAWAVMSAVFHYAASLVPEISDNVTGVDDAMKLGYNWKKGPFELIDELGADYVIARMQKDGRSIPAMLEQAKSRSFYKIEGGKRLYLTPKGEYTPVVRPEGVLLLEDIKLSSQPVAKNGSASLWDVGDGVLCVEFTSKMNSIDDKIFEIYEKAIKTIGDGKGKYKALVIYNEGENFSVGANLGLALFALNIGLFQQVEEMISQGQKTYKKLKYAPFPVVGAPSGMALGGGCEILLHCDAVQAHAETYTGLVEVGVGVVPGWGGCKEIITRYATDKKAAGGAGPMPAITKAFQQIGMAQVAKSAAEARNMMILRKSDDITMNRDRLLFDAKQKALKLAEAYAPPQPVEIRLPGKTAKYMVDMTVDGFAASGKATPHDVVVSKALSTVLTGGDTDITTPISEDKLLELERKEFLALVHTEGTLARIEHMLDTGKPLRN
jgi:3-hydroxyacyl-CoA dehydrogenase